MLPVYGRSGAVKSLYLIIGRNGWLNGKEFRSFHRHSQKYLSNGNNSNKSLISGICCLSKPADVCMYHNDNAHTTARFRSIAAFEKNVSLEGLQNMPSYNNNYMWKRHFSLGHSSTAGAKGKQSPRARVTVKPLDGGLNKLQIDEDEWQTVYRFKYIRLARVIQRLKIYQTFITTCLALPASVGCYLYNAVPVEAVGFMLGSSVFACGMLYIMGGFCSRLIGIIYTCKNDDNMVRIAHLNFWGKREDQFISKTDFIPFSELPDNVSDIYVNVRFYSEPESKLHICVKYGTVYDKYEFIEIFGSHSGLEIYQNENKPKK